MADRDRFLSLVVKLAETRRFIHRNIRIRTDLWIEMI